jgi:streptogramin lyase
MNISSQARAQLIIGTALALAGAAVYFLFAKAASPPPVGDTSVFRLGGIPHSVAATPDAIWVTDLDRRLVLKLDPVSGQVEARQRVAFVPGELVVTDDFVWVGAIEDRSIVRLRVEDAEVVDEIEVGLTPQSLTADEERVWVAAFDDGIVRSIDAVSGEFLGEPIRDGEAFWADLTYGFDKLWLADVVADKVLRIDSAGNRDEIPVGDSPTGIVAGEGSIWTSDFNARTVTRIDPESLEPGRPILIGGRPGGLATGAGYVWVTRPEDDALIRIDAQAGSWTGEVIKVGVDPQGVSVTSDAVWVANQGDGTISRVDLAD